jgi:hypothetical protein
VTRHQDGRPAAAVPIDLARELRKTREMRFAPQLLTPAKARAKSSLAAAIKSAKARSKT